MRPTVLVAAPVTQARRIASNLLEFETELVTDVERALALIAYGTFQAVVTTSSFLPADAAYVVAASDDDSTLPGRVTTAVAAFRAKELEEGRERARFVGLEYDELMQLVRNRETRRYLIALLHRHQGSVTHAARAAGIVRESLHRLLRRHDLDAEAFRSKPG